MRIRDGFAYRFLARARAIQTSGRCLSFASPKTGRVASGISSFLDRPDRLSVLIISFFARTGLHLSLGFFDILPGYFPLLPLLLLGHLDTALDIPCHTAQGIRYRYLIHPLLSEAVHVTLTTPRLMLNLCGMFGQSLVYPAGLPMSVSVSPLSDFP